MHKPPRTKKPQQSIWLMLGSAVALSLGGWAAIITHTPDHTEVPTVVELPPVASGAQAEQASEQNTAHAQRQPVHKVRSLLRSRSSN